ncbi:MAG: alpha/beta hydrolase [Epulopiscium sp.]|nr:alpha/beta hydrolase [Candidatus Epulonipiscium sp.]NLM13892.1 alpha/beta hydrolase [Candidatus Epulonipiscium sp.]
MDKTDFAYQSRDNIKIYGRRWMNYNVPIKGVVQIAHGMGEHIGRYEEFAKYLGNHGYIVYANDHRGHGRTGELANQRGYFSDKHGWEKVVSDMAHLTNIIRKNHPRVPVFLFGHSMGSLLSRDYIIRYSDRIKGVILSGTSGSLGIRGILGQILVWLEMKIKGPKAPSPLMYKLSFEAFNDKFQPAKTHFDWLSRDEEEVDQYIKDPFCGGVFTTSFFNDLIRGTRTINIQENINKVSKELPIYIFSGEMDPVGNYSKGVQEVYNQFKKAGIKDVSIKIYANGRHEMLNEINKYEVYKDILNWIETHNKL